MTEDDVGVVMLGLTHSALSHAGTWDVQTHSEDCLAKKMGFPEP